MAINLTTVNEVIDALGGNAEAAEALEVQASGHQLAHVRVFPGTDLCTNSI